nr:hypothetical protein [Solicola gregarius]
MTTGPSTRASTPPDHRAAAAVRDDRDARVGAPVEQGDDVGLRTRPRDPIGYVLQIAAQVAYDVAKRLAVRVTSPIRGRIGA